MIHSDLDFFLELKNEQKSILEIAEDLYLCIKEITVVKPIFSEVQFLQKKGEINIELDSKIFIKTLAENILSYSLKDIKQFDKIESPDINFSRSYGFTFALLLKSENSELCLTFKLGSDSGNKIGTISNKSKSNNSFDWYNSILQSFTKNLDVDFGVVRPNDMDYLDICYDNYEYSLGWISYFSNNYKLSIPDDLNGIKYQYTDNGKYTTSTEDNFDNNFEVNKQKLLTTMKTIAERVSEYKK